MYKENLPSRLKKARADAGYTQRQVADIVNIRQSKIAMLETGRIEPDIESLGILADFYYVSVDWLLGMGPKEPQNTPQKPKPKFFDQAITAYVLYGFLLTLPMKDKIAFLWGQLPFERFVESDFFKKLSQDQIVYALEEFEYQQWIKDREEWIKQLKKDGEWKPETLTA